MAPNATLGAGVGQRARQHPVAEPRGPSADAPAGDAPVRDGHAGDRFERFLLRLTVLAALASLVALEYVIVSPVLPESFRFWEREATPPAAVSAADEPTQGTRQETASLPERPKSAPARIPQWAWQMHNWHLTSPKERGARPAKAPARLPAWYWEWRKYRLALAEV